MQTIITCYSRHMINSFDDGMTPLTELADVILRVARELDPQGPRGVAGVVALTGSEALILRCIHRNPGCCASDVSSTTAIARSNVSVALRSLEGHGLIRRHRDEHDGRTSRLFVTDKADRNLERLRAHWSRRLTEALGGDTHGVEQARALLSSIDEGLHRTQQ